MDSSEANEGFNSSADLVDEIRNEFHVNVCSRAIRYVRRRHSIII